MPFFENRTLSSLTRADVNEYIDQKMAEGLAPRTLDAHLTFLCAVCRFAVERSWIDKNPVAGVERPRPDDPDEITDGPRHAHTVEEVAAVLRACDAFERTLFTTAYYTGMRLGEHGEAISTLQATLGHADVRTTMGYIVGYHERGDEGASIEQAFLTTRGVVTVPETSQ